MKRRLAITAAVGALCLGAAILALWGPAPEEKKSDIKTGAADGEVAGPAEVAAVPLEDQVPEPRGREIREDTQPGPRVEAPARPRGRLLWEIRTASSHHQFVELVPAGEKLLAMRGGVLYALDVQTGRAVWRSPGEGAIFPFRGFCLIQGVLRDRVIAKRPREQATKGGGVLEIQLSDGTITREFVPRFRFPFTLSTEGPPFGPRMAFWAASEDRKQAEVSIFDLAEWKEIARFELAGEPHDVRVMGNLVLGFVAPGRSSCKVFVVDLDRNVIRTQPVRRIWRGVPPQTLSLLLPDGSRLVRPRRTPVWNIIVEGSAAYARNWRDLARVNPKDGSVLWRVHLGFYDGLNSRSKVAAGGGTVAVFDRRHLHILDAETGSARAGMRVLERKRQFNDYPLPLACDGPRAYFACPTGLRAYSTHAADPARADPEDLGDPAHHIRACRRKLREGEFEDALMAIAGIAPLVQDRPAARREVAELLSQLARSPAARFHPALWKDVMLSDGWTVGEVFLDELSRHAASETMDKYDAIAALHAIDTNRSLAVLAGLDDKEREEERDAGIGRGEVSVSTHAQGAISDIGEGFDLSREDDEIPSPFMDVIDHWASCRVEVEGPGKPIEIMRPSETRAPEEQF